MQAARFHPPVASSRSNPLDRRILGLTRCADRSGSVCSAHVRVLLCPHRGGHRDSNFRSFRTANGPHLPALAALLCRRIGARRRSRTAKHVALTRPIAMFPTRANWWTRRAPDGTRSSFCCAGLTDFARPNERCRRTIDLHFGEPHFRELEPAGRVLATAGRRPFRGVLGTLIAIYVDYIALCVIVHLK